MSTVTTVGERHVHDPALSADLYPDDELVLDLTDSLRSRVAPTDSVELEQLVRATLDELAPVHVTNFLAVLVERRLRANGRARPRR